MGELYGGVVASIEGYVEERKILEILAIRFESARMEVMISVDLMLVTGISTAPSRILSE